MVQNRKPSYIKVCSAIGRPICWVPLAFLVVGCLPNRLEPFNPILPPTYYTESLEEDGTRINSESWWKDFMDPYLSELYNYAKEHNYEIQIAREQFQQLGFGFGITKDALDMALSSIDVAFDIKATPPGALFFREVGLFSYKASSVMPATDLLNDSNDLRMFDMSVELDLFQKSKSFKKKALNRMAAEERNIFGLYRSLRCDVAIAYTKIRTLQARKANIDNYIEELKNFLSILESRIQAGLEPLADWNRASSLLSEAELKSELLGRDLQIARYQLTTLVGNTDIQKLDYTLGISYTIPALKETIYAGAPLDLLKNRGDVQKAEKLIDEAAAEFGIAWANQFPSIRLDFTIETAAEQISGLIKSGSLLYALGYNIQYNVFERWKINSYYYIAKSLYQERIAGLNQVIAQALQEVSSSLVFFHSSCKLENDLRTSFQKTIEQFENNRDLFRLKGSSFMRVIQSHYDKTMMQDRFDLAQEGKTLTGLELIQNIGG